MPVRSLLVDNSSLSFALSSSARTRDFADHLSKSGATCYVSQYTLQELLANEAVESRTAQLEELANLVRRLPPSNLRLAADYADAIVEEMNAPLTGPVLAATDYLQMLRAPDMEPVVAPDIGSHTRSAVEPLFETDRGLRDARLDDDSTTLHAAFGSPSDKQIATAIRDPGALHASFMTFEWAADASRGRWTCRQIFEQPARFPTIHAFAHLVFRQVLANLADPDCAIDVVGAFKTKKKGGRGNWGDARVCATAVHVDMFVVDDGDLKRRATMLKEDGVVGFSSCTLDELLA